MGPVMDGSRPALFYNTKMFREVGLNPQKPPQTFDELMVPHGNLRRRTPPAT